MKLLDTMFAIIKDHTATIKYQNAITKEQYVMIEDLNVITKD